MARADGDTWGGLLEGLTLLDEAADGGGGEGARRGAAERKLARHARQKPLWYRRLSGSTTKGTKRRLRALWPAFGVSPTPPWGVALDLPQLFAPARPVSRVVLDVGFGDGTSLVRKAQELQELCQNVGFVGCEWHESSVGSALTQLSEARLDASVRVLRGDFVQHLKAGWMGAAAVDEVCFFFPDPWPCERDRDRRVISLATASLLAICVKPGGFLHVATDVREYAVWVASVMREAGDAWEACTAPLQSLLFQSPAQAEIVEGAHYRHSAAETAAIHGLLADRPRWRPVTRYESKGISELGHSIYDLCFRRRCTGPSGGPPAEAAAPPAAAAPAEPEAAAPSAPRIAVSCGRS